MEILKFFIFLATLSFQIQVLNSQNLSCNTNDLKAIQSSWTSLELQNPERNQMITCNGPNIVKIELVSQRLTGQIPKELSTLDQLKTLNLSRNFLSGSVPIFIFHLQHLEILDLSNNNFSGSIPMSINLPSLKVLNFSYNSFLGSIPSGICHNSTRIRVLQLAVNYFNGSISSELEKCNSIVELSLASNLLSGSIPEFLFHSPNLTQINLKNNIFSGPLRMRNNNELSRLEVLDVAFNALSGNLPDFFHNFPNLRYFGAQSNLFSGEIPFSLANSQPMATLLLRNNSLNGTINVNCSAMTNLVSLDLGTNMFSGHIPNELPSCRKLKAINLARTRLTGHIPESFKNFQSLSFVSTSNSTLTNLSASLKILQFCHNLTTLILTQNFLQEQLPFDDNLQFKSLKVLIIAHSGLKGRVPIWLKHSPQLQFLDLSWNQLTGTIPPFLGNFTYLFYLSLSNNSLAGEIPRSLTQLKSFISQNITLDEPSPDFPIFKIKNITTERSSQYNHPLRFPPTLDLSVNFLTGPIWPEFGNLKKLHILDLRVNQLSGGIPDSLSRMTSLETLDLSNNSLSGSIPQSLATLSFLSNFNVAYNKLTGIIPTGGQFSTFQESSFEGNSGLCGQFISNCQPSSDSPVIGDSEDENGAVISRTAVLIGFGAGFVVAVVFFVVGAPELLRRKKTRLS